MNREKRKENPTKKGRVVHDAESMRSVRAEDLRDTEEGQRFTVREER